MTDAPTRWLDPEAPHRRQAWGILWRQENRLDGRSEWLVGSTHPCGVLLFRSRQDARDHVAQHYGYIRQRRDLQREPHRWKMPVVVKVRMEVTRA